MADESGLEAKVDALLERARASHHTARILGLAILGTLVAGLVLSHVI